MSKILVIPDTQCRPGDDFTFLTNIGNYIVEKQPDTIVCLGDFADMPSLSSYDVGKKSFEGRRYVNDVEATHEAMAALLRPLLDYNQNAAKHHKQRYRPRRILTLGNHEDRINRAVNNDAKLEGVLSISDLKYDEAGWEVYPYQDVVVIDGVAFSHNFPNDRSATAIGTAQALVNKRHMSCVAGHQQGLQIHTAYRADGKRLTGIIAGSCYEHDEDYMSQMQNRHWRGILVLHEVRDGEFDLMPVSLGYINKKYGA